MTRESLIGCGGCVIAVAIAAVVFALLIWSSDIEFMRARHESAAVALDITIADVRCGKEEGVRLYDTVGTDSLLHKLVGLKGLKSIMLEVTDAGDCGMSYLKDIPDLHTLTLCGMGRITDAGMGELAQCLNLKNLSLMNVCVTDAGIAGLRKCARLKTLSIMQYTCPVHPTDKALEEIADIPTLTTVAIDGGWYTQAAVDSLRRKRPDLKIIVGSENKEEQKGRAIAP
jgi:hypothetical protein